MTPPHVSGPTAALAGIPAGLQAQGMWAGRRQLFIRFAVEAETATMYTADALANEIRRSTGRSKFHSISISGRDPLSSVEYLCSAFAKIGTGLPVMLDVDGQRPGELAQLNGIVSLVQVTLEGAPSDVQMERAFQSLQAAAASNLQHALVIAVDDRTSDAQILRIVEQARGATEAVSIVVHPSATAPVDRDRRWITMFERISSLHNDVRLALKLPPPTGMR